MSIILSISAVTWYIIAGVVMVKGMKPNAKAKPMDFWECTFTGMIWIISPILAVVAIPVCLLYCIGKAMDWMS